MDRNIITRLSDKFAQLSVWSLKNRWWVFTLCMIFLGYGTYLASSVRMDNSFEAFFDANDQSYSAYKQYRKDFGSDEIIYLLYDASKLEHGVFNLALMHKINQLTQELEIELPFVKDVDSISNAEVTIGNEDAMDIIELQDDFPKNQAQMNAFAELFMTKSMYQHGLISPDKNYGAIQVEMTRSSTDPVSDIRLDPKGGDGLENVYPQVTDTALFNILAKEEYQGIKFHVSGDVPFNAAFNRLAYSSMNLSFTLCFIVIFILLLIFFKGKWIGAIGPLSIVILTILMTTGFISLMGWNIDMMFSMVPTLLIVVGTAHAVHIISEFRIYYARLGDREKAIKETFYLVATPCLLTSLTTAAGFLALSISPIKAIEHMAIYTGIAVLIAFFLSLTFLIFFLSFGKPESEEKLLKASRNPFFEKILETISEINIRYPKQIVLIGIAIFMFAGLGITKIKVDSNFLLDFKDHVPVRQATEFIDKNLGGVGSGVYLFETGIADAVKDPELLKEIEALQAFIDQQKIVTKTYSIVDLIKDINQSFHDGDPAYYKIPDNQDLVAQYLLMYEFSGGEELRNFISEDYSRTTIEVRTAYTYTSEFEKLKVAVDDYLEKHPLEKSNETFTGINALWLQLVDYIVESQIKGVLLAFTIITVMMCFIFQSFKVGLISMIPNTGPALLTVGLIGWIGEPLDYMKLMIAPIAIGIAVDDTIHLMTRFHHEFKRLGNYNDALRAALRDVGRAITMTSIVLIVGFLFFLYSPMNSQFWFGSLLAGTIFVALIADFFLMPALVLLTKPFGEEFTATNTTANT